MTVPTCRRSAALLVCSATVTAALALAGCTDDGGATGDFCAEVKALPSLEAVLSRFSDSDPDVLDERIEQARDAYHQLADAAPTEVAAATEDVVDLVDAILDAVADHPDDPTAAADQLRAAVAEHPDVEASRTKLAAFAEDRCDVELDPTLSGSDDDGGATTTTGSTAATTTVAGG